MRALKIQNIIRGDKEIFTYHVVKLFLSICVTFATM